MEPDDDLDPWLTTAQAASLAGMTPGSWRRLSNQGYVPPPDDPGDQSVHRYRRTLRWRRSSVIRYIGRRRVSRGKATEETEQNGG